MVIPNDFRTTTFARHSQGAAIERILTAAIQAVAPDAAIRNFVTRQGDVLTLAGNPLHLSAYRHIYILAFGKAAPAMAAALVEILGDRLTAAWLAPKHLPKSFDPRFTVIAGGHPLPTTESLRAGSMILAACSQFSAEDLVFCLISGGGSALLTAPPAGISLKNLQALTQALLTCGARIDEINTLRRHLDLLKGGGLARQAAPARVISLILSDVVNNPLEAIASGPTVADPTSKADALHVLEKYALIEQTPIAIHSYLREAPETPKPGDPLFENVENWVVASNEVAARAAAAQAKKEGFQVKRLGNDWQGEARDTAKILCQRLHDHPARPLCLIAGGETTVTIRGTGVGGRNQELALAAVPHLAGVEGSLLVTLATDGEDGPTGAAGAVVTGETEARAAALGMDAAAYLANNNAYPFFDALGDLLKTGATGTNVNDLTFLFRF